MGQGAGISPDGLQLRLQIQLQEQVRQGRPFQKAELLPDQRVQIEPVALRRGLAGKAQQALDHLAAPFGGLADGVEGPVEGTALGLGGEVGRGQAEDGAQDVVHVVSHPTRQNAQALHFLGLLKLGLELRGCRLGLLALGDIGKHQANHLRALGVQRQGGDHVSPEGGPVPLHHPQVESGGFPVSLEPLALQVVQILVIGMDEAGHGLVDQRPAAHPH